jgi:DUF1680 family protein
MLRSFSVTTGRGLRPLVCATLAPVLFAPVLFAIGAIAFWAVPSRADSALVTVQGVQTLPTAAPNAWYPSNRAPLAVSPLVKLPPGSIEPRGWLRGQLNLAARGMTGRLDELSPWLRLDKSAWASPEGKGDAGWEELPYWLKGYGDLGYVLGDPQIIAAARKWIEAVLASQSPDGWFGPRELKASLGKFPGAEFASLAGKPDLWPHMVMLNVLQSYYDYSHDERVLRLLSGYFAWQAKLPDAAFGAGYWPRLRMGDNLETIYWLYNRTGDKALLALAERVHKNMGDWTSGVPNWHNVNVSQGFREPAIYFVQAKDPGFLHAVERNYETIMGRFGQVPGGGFAGDENCRPGYGDPRQGFETCGIVEFLHSFEMLTAISGDPVWADRCEELAFNSLPAAMTPDLKGLHYLTCANLVQADKGNKHPGFDNGGCQLAYSPHTMYRCCQHNVSHGWPYYAENLWLATADNGLCASLYAASRVTAKVGDGTQVVVTEETDYPFSDRIVLKIAAPHAVRFPFVLRVPRWSGPAVLIINGKRVEIHETRARFVRVERTWNDGDTITLELPMSVHVRTWKKNHDAVSVDYGPLTFSLKIDERWQQSGGTPAWPDWEVFPASPWNYGLVLDTKSPENGFQLVRKPGPLAEQPFTAQTTPLELRATARRIPAWRLDRTGLVGLLQPSPVRSAEPEEMVTLIPMGAARLRISAFPTIGNGPEAHDWVAPVDVDVNKKK